jgi:hypothetical protein
VLPSPIHLTVDVRDVLVLTNDDEAIHPLGPIVLGSRQTYRIQRQGCRRQRRPPARPCSG